MIIFLENLEKIKYWLNKNWKALKFNYKIIDRNGLPEDDADYFGRDFKNLIGDILCDIVDRHYSRKEVFSGTKSDDREDNAKSTDT